MLKLFQGWLEDPDVSFRSINFKVDGSLKYSDLNSSFELSYSSQKCVVEVLCESLSHYLPILEGLTNKNKNGSFSSLYAALLKDIFSPNECKFVLYYQRKNTNIIRLSHSGASFSFLFKLK